MRSFDPTNYSAYLYGSLILKNWLTGNEGDKQLSESFLKHNQAVRDFFSDKPGRFLEMNIINGDGWEILCPFLGKQIPKCSFPNLLKPIKNSVSFNTGTHLNTLALATMILPRMEIDHIEEWISWHYEIGIRNFWIVCDEPIISDVDLGQLGGIEWAKKPWANYHLDLSNEKARQKIDEIAHECELKMPYINIRICDIKDFSNSSEQSICQRQTIVANKVSSIVDGLVDWLGFIDIDELLETNVIEKLNKIKNNPEISTVRMCRQRLMGNRFVKGKSISFRDITESWGIIPDDSYSYQGNGKSFVRPGRGLWQSVHRAHPTDNGINLNSKNIIFYHFHGLEAINKTLEVGWDVVFQWAKKNAPKSQHCSHKNLLCSLPHTV